MKISKFKMTRFARASKKTSLEATPWHELVNSGENYFTTEAKIKYTCSKLLSEMIHTLYFIINLLGKKLTF